MQIEYVDIDKLIPYAKNAKKHPQEQVEQIKQSISEFGFNDPLAIDEGNVLIEGHGRLMAAKELGYTELPCIRLTELTEQQKKAYILAHNKLTMNSGFDLDLLNQELTAIEDFDMADFGFDVPDLLEDDGDDGYYGDERERTYEEYNLDDFDGARAEGFYQMPIIEAQNAEPDEEITFKNIDDLYENGMLGDKKLKEFWESEEDAFNNPLCMCVNDDSSLWFPIEEE